MIVERFYQHIFKQEEDLIAKIKEDESLWHLVLVGWRHHTLYDENRKKPVSYRRVISAISFKPLLVRRTVLLCWLANSLESTNFDTWCSPVKDEKKKKRIKKFFDGKAFSNGKGLGTLMVALMQ
jgi:hypothetical protein